MATTALPGRTTPDLRVVTSSEESRRSFQGRAPERTTPLEERRSFQGFPGRRGSVTTWLAQVVAQTPTIAPLTLAQRVPPRLSLDGVSSAVHHDPSPTMTLRHSPDRSTRGCKGCASAQELISRLKAQLAAAEWQLSEASLRDDSRSTRKKNDASGHSVQSQEEKKIVVTVAQDQESKASSSQEEDVSSELKSPLPDNRDLLQPPQGPLDVDVEADELDYEDSELDYEGDVASLDEMLRHGKLRELLAQAAVTNPDPDEIRVVRQTLSSKSQLTLDDLTYDRRNPEGAGIHDAEEEDEESSMSGSASPCHSPLSRVLPSSDASFTSSALDEGPYMQCSISPRNVTPFQSHGGSVTCRCGEGSICTCAASTTTTTTTTAPITTPITTPITSSTITSSTITSSTIINDMHLSRLPPKHSPPPSITIPPTYLSSRRSFEHKEGEDVAYCPGMVTIYTPAFADISHRSGQAVRRNRQAAFFKFPPATDTAPKNWSGTHYKPTSSPEESSEVESRSHSPRLGPEAPAIHSSTPPLIPSRENTPPLPLDTSGIVVYPNLERQRTLTPKQNPHHLQILAPIRESTETGQSPSLRSSVIKLSSPVVSPTEPPRRPSLVERAKAALFPGNNNNHKNGSSSSSSSGSSNGKRMHAIRRTKSDSRNSSDGGSGSRNSSTDSNRSGRSCKINEENVTTNKTPQPPFVFPNLTITSPSSHTLTPPPPATTIHPIAQSHSPKLSVPRINPNYLTIETSGTSQGGPLTSPRRRKSWPFDPVQRSLSDSNLESSSSNTTPSTTTPTVRVVAPKLLTEEKKYSPQRRPRRPSRLSRSPSPLLNPIEHILRKQLDVKRAVEKKIDSSPLYTAHLALNALSCVSRWAARIQEFEDPSVHVNDYFEYDIFLGGACNPTTWRQTIAIPLCERAGVKYYNPQVDNWTPDLVQIEAQAKEDSYILLFIVSQETRGLASLVEASEYISSGRNVILVVDMVEQGQIINSKTLSKEEVDDLNRARRYLIDVCTRYGVLRFPTVESGLAEGLEQIRARQLRQERYAQSVGDLDHKDDQSRHSRLQHHVSQ